MRAVAREAAFEQDEFGDLERLGTRPRVAFEEACTSRVAAAFPTGERDVGMVGAALGLEADRLADALDLGGERGEWLLGLDARPQRAGVALLETADAVDARSKTGARTLPSAAARSSATGRSTSPTKRNVKCSCSSSCQRKSGLSSIASISRSRMCSGGRMATNSRCMARV